MSSVRVRGIIRRVDAVRLPVALREPFGIATGAQAVADNVFVRVTLASGIEGFGEAAPFTAVSGETAAGAADSIRALAERLIGRHVGERFAIASELFAIAPADKAARSALEQAVFDALAQHWEVPLWELFGSCDQTLETDVTITAGDVADAERLANGFAARGFRSFKVKVGGAHASSETLANDLSRVQAVAQIAGARLLLDGNEGYRPKVAIELLRRLDERGLHVELFEQPGERSDTAGLSEVRSAMLAPVCADESVERAVDVMRLARAEAVDATNIKIMKSGVAESIAIWHAARAAGQALMVGGMVETEIAMTFSAQLARGLGGFSFVDLDTPLFLKDSPVLGGLRYHGARVVLPDVPGLGAKLPPEYFTA